MEMFGIPDMVTRSGTRKMWGYYKVLAMIIQEGMRKYPGFSSIGSDN